MPRIDKVIVVILEGHKIKLPPSAMMYMLQTDFVTRIKEDKIFIYLFIYIFIFYFFTVVQVQSSLFPHHHSPTPAIPTSHSGSYLPLALSVCPL